jgi:hypothetical protein
MTRLHASRRFFERRDCVEQIRALALNVCTRYSESRRRLNLLEFIKNSSDIGDEFLDFFAKNPAVFSFKVANAPPVDSKLDLRRRTLAITRTVSKDN